MGREMNSEKELMSNPQEGRQRDLGKYITLSLRNAGQMHKTLWPHLWMSFASIILLVVALAILSYRIGAQSCH